MNCWKRICLTLALLAGFSTVAMAGAYDLTITVLDCACKAPQAGLTVIFNEENGQTTMVTTGLNGQATYTGGSPGDVILVRVEQPGSSPLVFAEWEYTCDGPVNWNPAPAPPPSGGGNALCNTPTNLNICIDESAS